MPLEKASKFKIEDHETGRKEKQEGRNEENKTKEREKNLESKGVSSASILSTYQ
jgi:hypothetical protein